jgi:hypothetical protein
MLSGLLSIIIYAEIGLWKPAFVEEKAVPLSHHGAVAGLPYKGEENTEHNALVRFVRGNK